jgi:polyisoprenyl-phosphate glycosyltransferase
MLPGPDSPIIILTPLYNDWAAAAALLPRLAGELARAGLAVEVVMVNDGSTQECPADAFLNMPPGISRLWRLDLRRNLGHQRAIAVGLAHLHRAGRFEAVLVMDCDGEDEPADVPRLIGRFDECGRSQVVFASRMRRSEGPVFAVFYWIYRHVHYLMTGVRVRVGNFACVPATAVDRLVLVPELWNHFAASVYKAKIPTSLVPSFRGRRLGGRSSMNLVTLIVHGLSSMSVFGDVIGVRLLIATGLLLAILAVGLPIIIALKASIWSITTAVLLLVLAVQFTTLSLFFVFGSLGGRQGGTFIPERDCPLFVRSFEQISTR